MSGTVQPFAGLVAAGVQQIKSINFLGSIAGPPQGVLAGQAGGPGLAPDIVWDFVDATMWVCTVAGSVATAVWTQIQFTIGGTFVTLSVSQGLTAGTIASVGQATLGNAIVQTTLEVGGNAQFDTTINVTGAATFNGNTNFVTGKTHTFSAAPLLTAGATLNNLAAIQAKEAGGAVDNILFLNAANNLTIRTSLAGTMLFQRQDGTTLGTLNNNGAWTTRTGTGTFRNTTVINPEGNGVSVTFAAGSAGATSFISNILTTSFNHAVFQVAGTTAGSITSPTGISVLFNTTSDYRIKDIDGLMRHAGAIVDGVPVYFGNYKNAPEQKLAFFLAHELQKRAPWAVTGEKDGMGLQQVDHSSLVAVLWAEVQALRAVLKKHGLF